MNESNQHTSNLQEKQTCSSIDTFKHPSTRQPLLDGDQIDHSKLSAVSHVRSLNFDQPISQQGDAKLKKRKYDTRSKVSLKKVTIEELDTQLVPPDITPDLYDTNEERDIWTEFLKETYTQPLPEGEKEGNEGTLGAVSYTHLTLPTKA